MGKKKWILMVGLALLLVLGMASQALASEAVIGIKLEVFDKNLKALTAGDSLMAGEEIYLDISLNCTGAAANEYINGYLICVDYRGCRTYLERVTSDGNPPNNNNQFTELTTGVEKVVNGVPAVTAIATSNINGFIAAANVQASGKLVNSILNNTYKPYIRYYFKAKTAISVSELEFIVSRIKISASGDPYTETTLYGYAGGDIGNRISYNFEETNFPDWPIIYHTVSFNTDGGTIVPNQVVRSGNMAIKPIDPYKSGYAFAGWFSDSAKTIAYTFTETVTGDITLYAKWLPVIMNNFYAYLNAPAKIYIREGKKIDYVVSVSNIGGDGSNLFLIEADFDADYLNYEGYTFALDALAYNPAQTDFSYDVGGKLSLSMVLARPGVLLKPAAETALVTFHFSLNDNVIPMETVIKSFLNKVTAAVFYAGIPALTDAVVVKPGAPVMVLINPLALDGGELTEATISWLIYHHLYKTDAAGDWEEIEKYDLNGNGMIDLADIVALWSLIGK